MGQSKIKSVIIDTNVLVSALLFGGVPGKLILLWKEGIVRPRASKEIIEEYIRVLAYPKFELSEEEINFLLHYEILPYFEILRIKEGPTLVAKDPSDDKFIRCAQAAGAKIIISGDQHLLKLSPYRQIRILSPSDFLALQERGL
ncbi:MAG: PilT protein domain protein [Deltaproteobacteria bacterium]|nr:PilT protein domain protein [Deltaproteobacteria bacterium]